MSNRAGRGRLLEGTREPTGPRWADWGATIIGIDVPREVATGTLLVALVRLRNSGGMAWHPVARQWGGLNLSYHLLDDKGQTLANDGPRFRVPRVVLPGQEVEFSCEMWSPTEPGDYVYEWDMVSENECWFSECGSSVARSELRVIPK